MEDSGYFSFSFSIIPSEKEDYTMKSVCIVTNSHKINTLNKYVVRTYILLTDS